MYYRILLSLGIVFLSFKSLHAQQAPVGSEIPVIAIDAGIQKQTFTYATKDSLELKLDVYTNAHMPKNSPCMLFVFGGGFILGTRDDRLYNNYFNNLVKNNYVVVSISYRLGLKGVKKLSAFKIEPFKHAVEMAVEDLYDATNWILKNADRIGVDPSKIILSGSSAGAIAVLQGSFEKLNNTPISKRLPQAFQYAGTVTFSGAILSFNGALKYNVTPPPAMLFHGMDDKLVVYDKIRLFNKGFYGSNHIAKVYKKHDYPYYMYREEKMGHEISYRPMQDNIPEILWFLEEYVINKKPYQVEKTFNNMKRIRTLDVTPKDLYK